MCCIYQLLAGRWLTNVLVRGWVLMKAYFGPMVVFCAFDQHVYARDFVLIVIYKERQM